MAGAGVSMRKISERRRLVEEEGHRHAVKRGRSGILHFENLPFLKYVFNIFLNITLTKSLGIKNALAVKSEEVTLMFADLPAAFDNTRILFMPDLHIDVLDGLTENIIGMIEKSEFDFSILGGDYTYDSRVNSSLACSRMKDIVAALRPRSRVFGVLGNHDIYAMAETLTRYGVEMLINENICLEKNSEKIYLAGMDDCHYYGADDFELTDADIPDSAFKIMICHSPEQYIQAENAGFGLYLTGHTHGGQVCLPGGHILVKGASVSRKMLKGKWRYRTMTGYTSRGAGSSSISVRFFCPPEITFITLKRSDG